MVVHNILTNQNKNDKKINHIFNDNPLITMNYQYQIPLKYTTNVRDRIKSRSFYQDNKRISQHKNNIKKNRTYCKFKQKQQATLSQPKIVQLGFDSFTKPKQKKQNQKSAISTHEYYTLMVDSMQAYIQKVQKGKKKKLQKCQKIKSFGVNIQAIRAKPEQQRFNQAFQKLIKSPNKIPKKINQQSSNQISLRNTQSRINELSVQNFMKTISTSHYSQPQAKKNKNFSKKLMFKYQKKDDDRKLSSKLNRMFKHFSIILSSFIVFLNRQQQKSIIENTQIKNKKLQKKYTYYVGPGNNKNLIVSILKKRWWWVEAQDMSSANLVWSQLKIGSILQKQTSMNYSQLQPVYPQFYRKDNNLLPSQSSNQNIQLQKIYNLFHRDHSMLFHNKLSPKDQKKYLRSMSVPNVVHNHYQANYMLGNKKALFYNITQYKRFKNQNCFQYMPLTFHIEKVNSRAWKQFQKKAKEQKKSLWIVKPGENSNRGQGIFVSDSIQGIKSKIQKNKKHTFIIQKYIKNNLTFQRRKFDIRTYVLMVSIGGVQKFYWYTEGYLRTASQIYDLTDLDDPFIHLTNDAIQATGEKYGKFQKGNKITYNQFQRYVDITYPNQKYSVPALVQRMKDIAKQVVEATYFKIDPCQKQYSFQLFGLDFLVDTNFKPWLLEVNTNPCLELSSPVLQRLIPRMIQNLFRVVVDPVFQPFQNDFPRNLACYIPQNIIESNRFELIFDCLHNRNFQWQQYSVNQNSNKVYQDQNQQFDNDGELIKIED